VEDDSKTLGMRRWRKRAEDREECAIILKGQWLNYKNYMPKKKKTYRYYSPFYTEVLGSVPTVFTNNEEHVQYNDNQPHEDEIKPAPETSYISNIPRIMDSV
jgi:hypothetical protein